MDPIALKQYSFVQTRSNETICQNSRKYKIKEIISTLTLTNNSKKAVDTW